MRGGALAIASRTVRVGKKLAEGSYGTVFVAKDEAGTSYALKQILCPTSEVKADVLREIRLSQSLSKHTGSVRVYGYCEQRTGGNEYLCMLMELCKGGTLIDFINTYPNYKLPEDFILGVLGRILPAIIDLHSREPSITHLDIKPENILLTRKLVPPLSSADARVARLCDYGSCHSLDFLKATPASQARGAMDEIVQKFTTPTYRAPELIDLFASIRPSCMKVTTSVDLFALGAALYKMMYYRDAFDSPLSITNGKWAYPIEIHTLNEKYKEIDTGESKEVLQAVRLASEDARYSALFIERANATSQTYLGTAEVPEELKKYNRSVDLRTGPPYSKTIKDICSALLSKVETRISESELCKQLIKLGYQIKNASSVKDPEISKPEQANTVHNAATTETSKPQIEASNNNNNNNIFSLLGASMEEGDKKEYTNIELKQSNTVQEMEIIASDGIEVQPNQNNMGTKNTEDPFCGDMQWTLNNDFNAEFEADFEETSLVSNKFGMQSPINMEDKEIKAPDEPMFEMYIEISFSDDDEIQETGSMPAKHTKSMDSIEVMPTSLEDEPVFEMYREVSYDEEQEFNNFKSLIAQHSNSVLNSNRFWVMQNNILATANSTTYSDGASIPPSTRFGKSSTEKSSTRRATSTNTKAHMTDNAQWANEPRNGLNLVVERKSIKRSNSNINRTRTSLYDGYDYDDNNSSHYPSKSGIRYGGISSSSYSSDMDSVMHTSDPVVKKLRSLIDKQLKLIMTESTRVNAFSNSNASGRGKQKGGSIFPTPNPKYIRTLVVACHVKPVPEVISYLSRSIFKYMIKAVGFVCNETFMITGKESATVTKGYSQLLDMSLALFEILQMAGRAIMNLFNGDGIAEKIRALCMDLEKQFARARCSSPRTTQLHGITVYFLGIIQEKCRFHADFPQVEGCMSLTRVYEALAKGRERMHSILPGTEADVGRQVNDYACKELGVKAMPLIDYTLFSGVLDYIESILSSTHALYNPDSSLPKINQVSTDIKISVGLRVLKELINSLACVATIKRTHSDSDTFPRLPVDEDIGAGLETGDTAIVYDSSNNYLKRAKKDISVFNQFRDSLYQYGATEGSRVSPDMLSTGGSQLTKKAKGHNMGRAQSGNVKSDYHIWLDVVLDKRINELEAFENLAQPSMELGIIHKDATQYKELRTAMTALGQGFDDDVWTNWEEFDNNFTWGDNDMVVRFSKQADNDDMW